MKKLFQKDEIIFAVLWIVVYVLSFSNADMASEAIGFPKAITVCVGLILSLILFVFVRRNQLTGYFGLCAIERSFRKPLYFLPLAAISVMNLLYGFAPQEDIRTAVLSVVCMCFVGFLEELIFRGFLFKAMCKSNVKTAIIVSSLTFGAGHIINLLQGQPVLETLLQLAYASSVGFCFTALFYVSGSIVPCILSHALVNSLSVFIRTPSEEMMILTAALQIAVSLPYGIWLLRQKPIKQAASQ